jgi:hypothetical protein
MFSSAYAKLEPIPNRFFVALGNGDFSAVKDVVVAAAWLVVEIISLRFAISVLEMAVRFFSISSLLRVITDCAYVASQIGRS